MNFRTLLAPLVLFILPFTAGAQAYVPVIDISMAKVFPDVMRDAPDSLRNIIAGSDPAGVVQEPCRQTNSRYINWIEWYAGEKDPTGRTVDIPPDADIHDDIGGGPWFRAYMQGNGAGPGSDYLPTPDFFQKENPRDIPREIGTGIPLNYNNEGQDGAAIVHTGSLRCLLMSLIEWQKLSINIQIHSMLRDYIAQAQNYALQTKLLGEMQAATIERVKRANQECTTDSDGNVKCTTRAAFVANESGLLTERGGNQIRGLADKITNDSADPAGSLYMIPSYQRYVKRQLLINNRSLMEDPRLVEEDSVAWTGSRDVSSPLAPFKTTAGGESFFRAGGMYDDEVADDDPIYALDWVFFNPQDTPLGASSMVNTIAQRRALSERQQIKDQTQAGGGFVPTTARDNTEDRYCTTRSAIMSGSILQGLSQGAVNEGVNTVRDSQNANEFPSNRLEEMPSDIQEAGLSGYQTKALQEADDGLRQCLAELPRELYRTAEYGYWNSPLGLTRWTQATMLTIFDELIQKPKPQTYSTVNTTVGTDTSSGDAIEVDP